MEQERTRQMTVGDHTYVLTCSDPYGFWRVRRAQGGTPKELDQDFTSFHEAEKVIYSLNA